MAHIIGLLCLIIGLMHSLEVSAHGRMWEPPSRATMFKTGEFPTAPINYDDNGLNCGSRANLIRYNGKCGVCGDPWQGPRKNEAGGEFATGIITRRFKRGNVMNVTVEITANHLGFMDFRLCPVNDPTVAATWDCMNKHLLQIVGHGTRYHISSRDYGLIHLQVQLPTDVVCTQCVFQWRYHGGNSWGVSPNGTGCLGCGYQEEFYACSDIAISGYAAQPTHTSVPSSSPPHGRICHAVNTWAGFKTYDIWCKNNCAVGNCPSIVCACT